MPPEDAGSASGVLNTAQQLGSAVGVAVIGVIFFGLLASQAAASAEQVTPGLRGGLQAAGVPTAVQQQMVAGFQACARDRAATQDPTEVPASCQQAQGQPVASSPHAGGRVQQIIGAAADDARKQVFSRATQQTLWFNAGVFVVSFLLSLLLPATPRGQEPQPDQRPTRAHCLTNHPPRAVPLWRAARQDWERTAWQPTVPWDDGDRRGAASPHTELP